MSYHDFEMGLTAEQVKELNKAGVVRMSEAQAKRKEAEKKHWDSIVTGCKKWKTFIDDEIERTWREATKPRRRRLH